MTPAAGGLEKGNSYTIKLLVVVSKESARVHPDTNYAYSDVFFHVSF
jgi:hypothetical protein